MILADGHAGVASARSEALEGLVTVVTDT